MNRIPVTSSNLASVGYDAATQTMEIEFNDGAIYQYFDLPQLVYQGLISAASAGQYFHAQVRGVYRYARV
jgi:hypothetical protein